MIKIINTHIHSFFKLSTHQTTLKTEVLAGLTTYFTMSYIIFVNPAMLSTTGMDKGAVFTATCLITAFSTLLIGFIANNPIAIAPGMALNTFFAYIVVQTHGYNWENALGMVFISGIIFLLLTLTKIRSVLLRSLPSSLNVAIISGISLLIALIALNNNHIIVVNHAGFLQLGKLDSLSSALLFLGFLLIIVLDYFSVPAAVLLGVLTISIINAIIDPNDWQGIVSLPPSIHPTFFHLRFDQINSMHAYKQVFSFFLIALFDATGTFLGLLNQPIFKKQTNNTHTIERGLLADSLGTTLASLLGSSSTSPFIESASGIEAGGRTGLTSVVVGSLFLLSLFVFPLASHIPTSAVGGALLYIACCMFKEIVHINVKNMTELAPSILIVIMIPFTFSIADGIGIGIICYTLLKLLTKQFKAINPVLIVLTLSFLWYFIWGT